MPKPTEKELKKMKFIFVSKKAHTAATTGIRLDELKNNLRFLVKNDSKEVIVRTSGTGKTATKLIYNYLKTYYAPEDNTRAKVKYSKLSKLFQTFLVAESREESWEAWKAYWSSGVDMLLYRNDTYMKGKDGVVRRLIGIENSASYSREDFVKDLKDKGIGMNEMKKLRQAEKKFLMQQITQAYIIDFSDYM